MIRLLLSIPLLALLLPQEPAPKTGLESLVILTGKSGGQEVRATGAVMHRAGGRGVVLTTLRVTKWDEGSIEAHIHAAGAPPARFPAKVWFTDTVGHLAMVGVEAAGLPAPIAFDAKRKVEAKESLELVGAASATEFGRKPIRITSYFESGGARWSSFDTFDGDTGWEGSIAVDSKGEVAGFFTGVRGTGCALLASERLAGLTKGLAVGGAWRETALKPGEIKGDYRCLILGDAAKIRSATLVLTRLDQATRPAAQAPDGSWSLGEGPRESFPLEVKDGEAKGNYVVRFVMAEDAQFVGQVKIEGENGPSHGPPEIYLAPFSKTKGAAGKDDDWIGGKEPGKGGAVETALRVAGPRRAAEDIGIVDFTVKIDGPIAFSEDGDYLYAIGSPNVLRKIRTSDLVQERQLSLPVSDINALSEIAVTKAGIAVLNKRPGELYIIDEGSLSIRKQVFLTDKKGDPRQKGIKTGLAYHQVNGMVASSNGRVFVTVEKDPSGQLELVVDMGSGRIIHDFVLVDVAKKAWESAKRHPDACPYTAQNLGRGVMTPDGRTLITGSASSLQRYKVSGTEVVLEEVGPVLGSHLDFAAISLSPDGLYVTMLHSRGHQPPRDHPILPFVNYIYRVSDLQKPWAVIHMPKEVIDGRMGEQLPIAFDRESRQIYLADSHFMIFDAMGKMTRRVALFSSSSRAVEMLVHPGGLKVAARTGAGLQWIELPAPK